MCGDKYVNSINFILSRILSLLTRLFDFSEKIWILFTLIKHYHTHEGIQDLLFIVRPLNDFLFHASSFSRLHFGWLLSVEGGSHVSKWVSWHWFNRDGMRERTPNEVETYSGEAYQSKVFPPSSSRHYQDHYNTQNHFIGFMLVCDYVVYQIATHNFDSREKCGKCGIWKKGLASCDCVEDDAEAQISNTRKKKNPKPIPLSLDVFTNQFFSKTKKHKISFVRGDRSAWK